MRFRFSFNLVCLLLTLAMPIGIVAQEASSQNPALPARSIRSELQGQPLRLKAWRDFVKTRAVFGSQRQAADLARDPQGRFITFSVPGAVDFPWVQGINPRGDIVGGYFDSSGIWQTFLLSHGKFRIITPQDAAPCCWAGGWLLTQMGINPQGDIVSSYSNGTRQGTSLGFLLTNGKYTPIDPAAGDGCAGGTIPAGINPQGDIVGSYTPYPDCSFHGFLLRDGLYTNIDVPGASGTWAVAINPQGDVLGMYDRGGSTHGFLLRNGTFTTIDAPGAGDTFVFGMNPQGDIVGFTFDGGSFLFSNGTFTPLDFPPGIDGVGLGIDPQGNIVGGYCDNNGCGGFLLKKN
jgi:hypothetical protein